MPPNDRLVIAVDFGTTYTGVAAAYSRAPETVEIIRTWPGGHNVTSDKVPTQFTYNVALVDSKEPATSAELHKLLKKPSRQELKSRNDIRWGYEVLPNEDRITCIKLFLDGDQKLPSFLSYQDISVQLHRHSRTVESAIADFLQNVRQHTISTLTLRWGAGFMHSAKIEWVMTVPAIWSDRAKNGTLRAAKQAGLCGKITMISEPEAAAVHTFTAIQPNKLKIGDNIVVCDAGGGTVDLISYKITKLKPLQVIESAEGEGGLCGGAFVNLRFQEHVKARLGEERFNKFKVEKPKAWRVALDFFEERVKRWFGATSMTTFEVPFPGFPDDEAAGIEDCFLILTSEQVKQIFDPIVNDVIALVEHQVQVLRDFDEKVTAILCVGGFGQSAYLQKRLEAHFETDLPPAYSLQEVEGSDSDTVKDLETQSIKVMVPTDCWTACVRGALQRGLQDSIVVSRKCRFNYGTAASTRFREGVHPESSKFWDKLEECYCADGEMQWYIKKGETVSNQREIKFPFERTWARDPLAGDTLVTDDLLASDSSTQAFMKTAPGVFKVCTLTSDLSAVPRRCFRPFTKASGVKHYKLSFDLVMTINSADIEFALEVDGETYGTVTTSFDHSESYELE